MKFFCVNEEHMDLSILQSLIEHGVCSPVDISAPALLTAGELNIPGGSAKHQSGLSRYMLSCADAHSGSTVARSAKEYVDRNYTDCECTLSGIAKSLYVSPGYLSAAFKETVGESFVDYMTGLRMTKAMQLIAGTELMIYEVAIMVGYENPTYFSTVFKKTAGISPKYYRQHIRRPATRPAQP